MKSYAVFIMRQRGDSLPESGFVTVGTTKLTPYPKCWTLLKHAKNCSRNHSIEAGEDSVECSIVEFEMSEVSRMRYP